MAVHDKESIAATLSPEIPKGRKGDNILDNPLPRSSGEVVLASKELAHIKKIIRSARTMPVFNPSLVILKYAICDTTCFPELKNTGNKNDTNIKEEHLLVLEKRYRNDVVDIAATAAKNTNSAA